MVGLLQPWGTWGAAFWGGLLMSLVVVLTRPWHQRYTADRIEGVQKFHSQLTPRVGGVAVYAAVVLEAWFAQGAAAQLLWLLVWAGLPAFAAGLWEDLTHRVSPRVRLLATAVSAGLAMAATGQWLQGVGVWGLDGLLQWAPVGVAFTALAVAGVANALNIVDGFNGLSSGTATLAFAGLAAIALLEGQAPLSLVCGSLAAVSLGFFAVNWPLGKLFLGDGGAYFLGFALGWCAVSVAVALPQVSPFAVLLVVVLPVTEVLFSMVRRLSRRLDPSQPDRQHLHSLLMRRYAARKLPAALQNPATGLLVALFNTVPVMLAVLCRQWHGAAVVATVAMVLAYLAVYARVVRHRWCLPLLYFLNPRRPGRAPQ